MLAIERDEVTAAVASYNLAPFPGARVELGDATRADLTGVGGVWLDPARREHGRRLNDPADWSPALDWAFDLARTLPTGIKLGPGIDRDLLPPDAEAQWISVDRDVVELVLWFGSVARPGIGRAALVLGEHGTAELTAEEDSPDAEPGELGQYLLEPDGAVIRARLIGELARRVDGRMLDSSIAWITTDAAPATPLGQAFRVLERFPLDVKTLKRELAARRDRATRDQEAGRRRRPGRVPHPPRAEGRSGGDPRAHPGRGRPGGASGRAGLTAASPGTRKGRSAVRPAPSE